MDEVRKKEKGFTLIEVVAAAAIVGIMATMLIPSLSGANDRVKEAKLKNDLATIDQALVLYHLDNGSFPTDLDALKTNGKYISGTAEFKDAKGDALTYTSSGMTYVLSGKAPNGTTDVYSPGSTKNNSGGS